MSQPTPPSGPSGPSGPNVWVPLGGKSRRYRNEQTGETISRRQYDERYGRLKRQGYRSNEAQRAARIARSRLLVPAPITRPLAPPTPTPTKRKRKRTPSGVVGGWHYLNRTELAPILARVQRLKDTAQVYLVAYGTVPGDSPKQVRGTVRGEALWRTVVNVTRGKDAKTWTADAIYRAAREQFLGVRIWSLRWKE